MSLEKRLFSVLVVSSTEKLNTSLRSLLSESHYRPICFVSSISAAEREWNERAYDFVIINSPLPDDAGMRFATDISQSNDSVVLFLLSSDIYGEFYDKASDQGVYLLSKPSPLPMLALALDWMEVTIKRLRKIQKKTLSFEEKMVEIRVVNRAKWILISELKMEEPDAHRYIEKQAMDRCISRREVAEEIISTYS
ncbi:MAG: ANTAR domain-containing protein [Clostridia bacterium]|jgi:response regulator NasT|nr:ANTAR domain-containing protein [Clostridia bacterium]MBQ2092179.1 ANTAR domain-containing protein [Clostridia bacterium]MBQ3897494.1 ANTAR domain-containing protein [Clostridia bacterium]